MISSPQESMPTWALPERLLERACEGIDFWGKNIVLFV